MMPCSAMRDPNAPRTVYLETFGCQMNVLDSQLVRGQLLGLGYRFTDDWRQADVVLYNTCSVREHAENKVWSRVGLVGIHKRENPDAGVVLGVIGCMAERDGADMMRRYPQIDLVCGPGELDKVPLLIDNVVKPFLIQGELELGGAVVFFALIGGIGAFGMPGLLIGPLAVATFLTLLRMYRRDFIS